jgi:hypothetical protein
MIGLTEGISAGVGILGGLFGGGQKETAMDRLYKTYNNLLKQKIGIANSVDFKTLDKNYLDAYSSKNAEDTMTTLRNYDAQFTGANAGKADTNKDVARTKIAGDSSRRVIDLAAQLDMTRAQRQLALLPSQGDVAGGFQAASGIDANNMANQNSSLGAVMSLAQLIQGMGKPKGSTTAPTTNPNLAGGAGGFKASDPATWGNIGIKYSPVLRGGVRGG